MKKIQISKPAKLVIATCFIYVLFAVGFDHMGVLVALGHGYGYGYGNNVDLSYKGHDVKNKKISKDSVDLCFDKTSQVAYYLLAKNEKFEGHTWKTLPDDGCVSLKVNKDFNNKKTRYYLRFKDDFGAVSKIFVKTLIYEKPSQAEIRVSHTDFKVGETMILRGRRFSSDNEVAVYFSGADGKFGAPIKVGTDQFGNIKFEHNVGRVKGNFSWYAVNLKTGKISKTIKFSVN